MPFVSTPSATTNSAATTKQLDKTAADMPLTAKLHADVARAIGEGNEKAAMQASDALIDYIENFTKLTICVDS